MREIWGKVRDGICKKWLAKGENLLYNYNIGELYESNISIGKVNNYARI